MIEKTEGLNDQAAEVLAILGQLTDPVLEQGDISDILTFVGLFQRAANKLPNGQGPVVLNMAEEHIERVLVERIKAREDVVSIFEQDVRHPWVTTIEKRAQTEAVSALYTRIITKAFESYKALASANAQLAAAPIESTQALRRALVTDGKTMDQRVGDSYGQKIDDIGTRLANESDHINPEDIKHEVIKLYFTSIIDGLSIQAPSEGIEEPVVFIFRADFVQKFQQAWEEYAWPLMSNMNIMQSIRSEYMQSVDHFVEYMEDPRARQKMHPVITAWRATMDALLCPPGLQLQPVPEISKNILKKKESKTKREKIEKTNERKREEHKKTIRRSKEFLACLGFSEETADEEKKDIAEILSLVLEIIPTKALHHIRSTEAALVEKINNKQVGSGEELSERMIHSKISKICRETYGLWGELVALYLYYGHRDRMLEQAEVEGSSAIADTVKRDTILETIAHRAPRGGWKYLSNITKEEQRKAH